MKVSGIAMFSSLFLGAAALAAADAPPHWNVAAMKARVQDEKLSFTVKDNWVTRFLQDGGNIHDVTGLLHNGRELTSAPHVDIVPDPSLPAAFDWRDKVQGGLTPVRDQGQCGSCWAFSVTGVLEQLQKIAHPNKEQSVDLSEQATLSCSGNGGCAGGYFDAFDYLKAKGLPVEADFPYKAQDLQCKRNLKTEAKLASWSYIGSSNHEPTTEQIKTAIMKYGPVSVDVEASFSSYESGIYDDCSAGQTDHMVVLVGWNDEGKYWIMRNSWGADWGEGGYMRIKYTGRNGNKCNSIGETAAFAELENAPNPFTR